jgi:hypothetical protein
MEYFFFLKMECEKSIQPLVAILIEGDVVGNESFFKSLAIG